MSEEIVQENVQESQETKANNNQESPSEPNYKQEMMKYKSQRNEEREENISLKAEKETGRQKKLEEDGKYKELIAEHSSTIEKLNAKLESQTGIVNNYKQNLVNGLASDDERKEYLSTKSVDFLEELTNEKNLMQPQTVSNPGESLGAVRSPLKNKDYANMTEIERRAFHEMNFKQN
jgi:hypothetical protein